MKIREIIRRMGFEVAVEANLDVEVTGGYVSDLLSDVMAGTSEGMIWLTIQTHENIIAVASLNELAAIVITADKKPSPTAIEKAREQGVNILTSKDNSFTVAGMLYKSGIKGV